MILKSRKCLVIIKLFWRAGGAAFSKGNEEGKVKREIVEEAGLVWGFG
jgi:hypothetical protein